MSIIIQTKEECLRRLQNLMKEIEDDSFEGIFVCSEGKETWGKWNRGDAQHRVCAADFVIESMYREPNEESKNYFMGELFKRWVYYFGQAYEEYKMRRSTGF